MSKYLGQHFLTNQNAIKKIIDALAIQKGDIIVEIGPGMGALTIPLCASPAEKIIAIEKDSALARMLADKFLISNAKFLIKEGDVLKVLPDITNALKTNPYKLIGNIPYYLTGYLFRVIGELERKPSLIVFTLQKEVAERICAKPPAMNKLAASIQIWAKPKIIAIVPPSDFDPPPKITSAIIKFNITSSQDVKFKNYYKLVKIIFKQPRKTILNNLSEGLVISKEKILERLRLFGLTGAERPGNLTIEVIHSLSTGF